MKRRVSIFLSVLFLVMAPMTAYAMVDPLGTSLKMEKDIFNSEFILERRFEQGKVIVVARGQDGSIVAKAENRNGAIYVNEVYLGRGEVVVEQLISSRTTRAIPDDIDWGSWSKSQTYTLKTGGLATAAIAAAISAMAPQISVRVAAAVASVVAGKYDELSWNAEVRYGYDSDGVMYYHTKWYFYGDGELVYGPYEEQGKTE